MEYWINSASSLAGDAGQVAAVWPVWTRADAAAGDGQYNFQVMVEDIVVHI